jgi:signal transduction histidine kinase/ligand-binding sensor domain-containing protein/DNA-binding response OmpR family regulator
MKVYQPNSDDSYSIGHRFIRAISEDITGRLWVGAGLAGKGGLYLFDRNNEKFTQFINDSNDTTTIDSDFVNCIYSDDSGHLWIGTSKGLNLFNHVDSTFKHFYIHDWSYDNAVFKYLSTIKNSHKTLAEILKVGNNANITKTFFVEKETPVLIVVMAEGEVDYGWIEDKTGKPLMQYDINQSCYAGGSGRIDNRIHIVMDTLVAGKYNLRYISDEMHSFGFWIGGNPDFPEHWGIQVFDVEGESKNLNQLLENRNYVSLNTEILAIIENPSTGNLYVRSSFPGLWMFNIKEKIFRRLDRRINKFHNFNRCWVNTFGLAEDGKIWISNDCGLARLDPNNEKLDLFQVVHAKDYNAANDFKSVLVDNTGLIWGGLVNGSLLKFNPQTENFQYYAPIRNIPHSLSRNSTIFSLFEDRTGIIWIGTWGGGINKLDSKKWKFKNYSYYPHLENNPKLNRIICMAEDKENNIWMGTSGGLLRFNRSQNTLDPKPLKKLNSSKYSIPSILLDESNNIWLGTYTSGLIKYNLQQSSFRFYAHNPDDPSSISGNYISEIYKDRFGIIWIGTHGGLNRFDSESEKFKRYQPNANEEGSISHIEIRSIFEDRYGILWVGTNGGGLNKFDRATDKFIKYDPFLGDMEEGSSVPAIYEDKSENFWVGTYHSGFHLFDRDKGISIKKYSEKEGLANNSVRAILEDDSGNLWISTRNGISKFNLISKSFRNFSESDGLQDNVFLRHSALKCQNGEILFGGENGFNIFHPDSIKDDPISPQVVITDINLINKPENTLHSETKHFNEKIINLSYDQNDLHFKYVALHYGEPEKNSYKYILENYNENWIDAGNNREATYTNLDPGEYTFRVKAANRDGIWNEEGASLKIIILPPWWATTWAYIIYGLIILSIIYFTWKLQLKRIRMKHDYEMSKFEAEKMHEVDEMKSRFFTNISHEFRTPLTLIFGPAKDISEKTKEQDTKKGIGIIKRNASRLYGLVNQLLDLSRLESGKMKFEANEQNIIPLLKGIFLSFTSFAERKKITLKFNTIEEKLNAYIDIDKVEKVINNLLSNAFKFTPEGGRIDFTVEKLLNDVEIRITDNGIGIPKERIDKIFDRFYQGDSSHTRQGEGTGIGLALTKELVELHKGKIKVESKEGEGTSVIVQIPLGKDHLKSEEIVEKEFKEEFETAIKDTKLIPEMESTKEKTDIDVLLETERPLILIVEDNSDVRSYIISHLEKDYRIQEAVDGEDGINQAIKHIPNLIISDVMMPKMDGFELCDKLKTDERTSHIPIIMLTAKATSKDKIEGYETGADDYIMKPFDATELKARIKNLIEIRKKLQDKFRSENYLIPREFNPADEQFIKKVLKVINSHISDEHFSIESLSKESAMSEEQIYKKLKALTGKSPSLFLRSIRLIKAKDVIKEQNKTISEISFQFGFTSPAYFTKCFKEEFGYPPSDLRS